MQQVAAAYIIILYNSINTIWIFHLFIKYV